MKEIGNILKSEREKQRKTLQSVSDITKISTTVLSAIEEGDLDNLPPKSFLMGFLRTYAQYLKLDPKEIIQLYKASLKEETVDVAQQDTEDLPSKFFSVFEKRLLNSKSIAVIVIILLISAVVGINSLLNKYEREREIARLPEDIKKIDQNEIQSAQGDLLGVRPQAEKNEKPQDGSNDPKPTEGNVLVAPAPAKPKEHVTKEDADKKAKEEADRIAKIEAEKKAKDEANRLAKLAAENKAKEEAEQKPANTPKKVAFNQELIIEALDRVTIEFQIDEQAVRKITLKPDQIHTIKASKSFSLNVSDGGAINVIFNGQDKGVPGELGQPKKFRFP